MGRWRVSGGSGSGWRYWSLRRSTRPWPALPFAMHEYEESIRLYFADSVRTLAIPSPWLRQAPSVYSLTTAADGGRRTARFESYEEAYQLELVHFHRCIVGEEACRTPPAQARIDQVVLTQMFRRSRGARQPA